MGEIFTFPTDGPNGTHLLSDVQLLFFQRIQRLGEAAIQVLGGHQPLVSAVRERRPNGEQGRFTGVAVRASFSEHPASLVVAILPHDVTLAGLNDEDLLFRICRELVGCLGDRVQQLAHDHSVLAGVLLASRGVIVEGKAPDADLLEFLEVVHQQSNPNLEDDGAS